MNSKILLIIIILIIAVGGFMILGGKKENPAPPATPEVTAVPTQIQPKEQISTITLTGTGFTPKDIIIKAGTKVTWVNKSGTAATVNSDNHPTHLLYPFLNLGEFANGATLQVAVEKAGKYSYHNHLNASETGTVTVE